MSAIRAGRDWGQRPTTVIMNDPFYGHRSFFTGKPLPGRDREQWIAWDFLLVHVFQIIEDNTLDSGLLRWVEESDRVAVVADIKIDKFQEAIEAKTSGKNYKARKGERFVPRVELIAGEMPTYKEYLEGVTGETGTIDE